MEFICCPVHKLEMEIKSYSQDENQTKEFAGPESLSHIDGIGTKTFSAHLYNETKKIYEVIYKCPHGCIFTCKQETINTSRLNRGISRQIRRNI